MQRVTYTWKYGTPILELEMTGQVSVRISIWPFEIVSVATEEIHELFVDVLILQLGKGVKNGNSVVGVAVENNKG